MDMNAVITSVRFLNSYSVCIYSFSANPDLYNEIVKHVARITEYATERFHAVPNLSFEEDQLEEVKKEAKCLVWTAIQFKSEYDLGLFIEELDKFF